MQPADISIWLQGKEYTTIKQAVFACNYICSPAEYAFVEHIRTETDVRAFSAGTNTAWLITKADNAVTLGVSTQSRATPAKPLKESVIVRIYRFMRDVLNAGRI